MDVWMDRCSTLIFQHFFITHHHISSSLQLSLQGIHHMSLVYVGQVSSKVLRIVLQYVLIIFISQLQMIISSPSVTYLSVVVVVVEDDENDDDQDDD